VHGGDGGGGSWWGWGEGEAFCKRIDLRGKVRERSVVQVGCGSIKGESSFDKRQWGGESSLQKIGGRVKGSRTSSMNTAVAGSLSSEESRPRRMHA